MTVRSSVRPRRHLVFPFVLALYPSLWFVFRDLDIRSGAGFAPSLFIRTLALLVGAVLVSYAFAVVASELLNVRPESVPSWARRFVAPSNATLAVFSTISLAIGTYAVAGSVVSLPNWLDTVAMGIGIVVGWPVFVVVLLAFAVGNAVGGGLPLVVQSLFVVVGIALSTTWLFVLSGWLAAVTTPETGG